MARTFHLFKLQTNGKRNDQTLQTCTCLSSSETLLRTIYMFAVFFLVLIFLRASPWFIPLPCSSLSLGLVVQFGDAIVVLYIAIAVAVVVGKQTLSLHCITSLARVCHPPPCKLDNANSDEDNDNKYDKQKTPTNKSICLLRASLRLPVPRLVCGIWQQQ